MSIVHLVQKPTLLLDRNKALRNIDAFVQKARKSGVHFRPHFKTHQSAVVGEWFRKRGVQAITVSSVDMAVYFAEHDWRDITIAFPVNLLQCEAINALARRVNLHLLVESVHTAEELNQTLDCAVNVWLKVDVGSSRTGIVWNDGASLKAVARAVKAAPQLNLQGLLTHDGRTYTARSRTEILNFYQEGVRRMRAAQATLAEAGVDASLSIGDTPACSVVESFEGVDEIRPGNFVFYDLQQVATTACSEEQIAVAVACPVVAKHEERQQIVVYGGAVHLSKDVAVVGERAVYGRVARLTTGGWGLAIDGAYVVKLSQEHGVIDVGAADFESINLGDLLLILPAHSCLTANLLRRYLTLEGEWIDMAPLT